MFSHRRPSCCSRWPRRARSVSGSGARSRCSVRTIRCGSFNRSPRRTWSRRARRRSPSAAAHSSSPLPCSVSISTTTKRCSRKTRVAAHAARPHARALGRPARATLSRQGVFPHPVQHPLPVWIGVGGTPPSCVRVGALGLRLMLAIIGGQPAQFRSLIERYREAGARAGHAPEKITVGVHSIGFLADPSALAAETFWPAYRETFGWIGRERGWAPSTRRSLTRNAVRLECGGSVTSRASPKRWFRRIVCSAVRGD